MARPDSTFVTKLFQISRLRKSIHMSTRDANSGSQPTKQIVDVSSSPKKQTIHVKNLKIIKFMGQLPFRYIQPESISKTKGWSNALPSIYLYYTVQVLKSTKYRAIYSTPTPWTSTPTPGVGEPRKHEFCNFFSSGFIHLGGLGALHD